MAIRITDPDTDHDPGNTCLGEGMHCPNASSSFCDRELWPITLNFELDLDRVKANMRAKYLGQRSFTSKVIVRTQTDTLIGPIALSGPLQWSVQINQNHNAVLISQRRYIKQWISVLRRVSVGGFSCTFPPAVYTTQVDVSHWIANMLSRATLY